MLLMAIAIGYAVGAVLTAALRWWTLRHCTSCSPRCPNGHRIEIAGLQGILFGLSVPIVLLLILLAERIT